MCTFSFSNIDARDFFMFLPVSIDITLIGFTPECNKASRATYQFLKVPTARVARRVELYEFHTTCRFLESGINATSATRIIVR